MARPARQIVPSKEQGSAPSAEEPGKRSALTAEWRYLAFFNYRVPAEWLEPHLVPGTELDYWDGSAWMSLVGLTFKNTRLLSVPVPLQQDYEQINLRFYVRSKSRDRLHGGVVFLKEIVDKPLLSFFARSVLHEKYSAQPTSRKIRLKGCSIRFEYRWGESGARSEMQGVTEGAAVEMVPGSHEEFIAQRLWSYTPKADSKIEEFHVEHPRWAVSRLAEASLRIVPGLFGEPFDSLLATKPATTFLAEGSEVKIFLPDILDADEGEIRSPTG